MRAKKKILIVEDEVSFARSMQRELVFSGYNVCGLVTTGEEAIKRVNQEKPDLVIMDILLDGRVDGLEATIEIRSDSDIPILLITGYDDALLIEQIKSIKSAAYLIKPFKPNDLETVITDALQQL